MCAVFSMKFGQIDFCGYLLTNVEITGIIFL